MGREALLPAEPAPNCATSRSSSTSWPTCGPIPKAPFVGPSAFAHKGGLHANAAQKVARSYEHIDPAARRQPAPACSSPTWPAAAASP